MTAALKLQLVAAHRSGDWQLAALLSQAREAEKKSPRHCQVCGVRVRRDAIHCRMHSVLARFYKRAINL